MTAVRESTGQLKCQLRWIPSALRIADSFTNICDDDVLRHVLRTGHYQIQSEERALADRAQAKQERLERGAARAVAAAAATGNGATATDADEEAVVEEGDDSA